MSKKSRRSIITLFVAASLALAGGIAPASAADTPYSKPYSVSAWHAFGPLGRCVKVTASGTITATIHVDNQYSASYINRKISAPTLTVRVYNNCTSQQTASLSKATIQQTFYDNRCSASYSLSVGAPWSTGVGATVSCGSVPRALRATTYASASTYAQYNSSTTLSVSGSATRWAINPYDPTQTLQTFKPCFNVDASVIAYVGSASDTWQTTLKACGAY